MKQRARVITIVWGRGCLEELLHFSLPALLAPGNLPILAKTFACEFVLVTESVFFEEIRQTPVFQQIDSICDARLVPLDDLVMTRYHYGLTLTYAYCRGFEDLGQSATDYFLIFFNSDFIMADGCYRALVQRLEAGERLVFAPSYCVIKEIVGPILRYERTSPVTHEIAIPSRELAALAIPNRHYTIRGKTVNQQMYSMDRIEQFYWCVDEHTLLAHQMPIALVCVKPERIGKELHTFWDYGVVSEMAPTTQPLVFDDSDDFLMIELRGANTYEEFLSLGWPKVEQIASDLSTFITKDHRDYGRYTLTLHSRDLPDSIAQAKKSLRDFVDEVYRHLPDEPVNHLNHPYWQASVADFERGKAEWRRRQNPGENNRLVDNTVGRVPRVRRVHPYWADLREPIRAFDESTNGSEVKVLLVRKEVTESLLEPMVKAKTQSCILVDAFLAENNLLEHGIGEESGFSVCLVEVNFDELRKLQSTYRFLRSRMSKHGRIIFFYRNTYCRDIARKNLPMLKNLTTNGDTSSMYFAGNKWTSLATRIFNRGQNFPHQEGRRLVRWAGYYSLTVVSVMVGSLGNWYAARQHSQRPSSNCTSVTVVIDLV